jgi:hypothetical protein
MEKEEKVVLAAVGAATGVSTMAGTVTVLVTTTKILGITVATTTVAVPVAGLIAAGGVLTFGGYKMWKWLRSKEDVPSGEG